MEKKEAERKREAEKAEWTAFIDRIRKTGAITKVRRGTNPEVWVKGYFWQPMTVDQKENFAYGCAVVYCTDANLLQVQINDANSGKKLGKYTRGWGLKIVDD